MQKDEKWLKLEQIVLKQLRILPHKGREKSKCFPMVGRMEPSQSLGGKSAATMPPHYGEVRVSSGVWSPSTETVVYNNVSYT